MRSYLQDSIDPAHAFRKQRTLMEEMHRRQDSVLNSSVAKIDTQGSPEHLAEKSAPPGANRATNASISVENAMFADDAGEYVIGTPYKKADT